MTFVCIKYFLISALLTEGTLLELLKNVTYLKKISMNPYFFFGFNIFKDQYVTFMYQLIPRPVNLIAERFKIFFDKTDNLLNFH